MPYCIETEESWARRLSEPLTPDSEALAICGRTEGVVWTQGRPDIPVYGLTQALELAREDSHILCVACVACLGVLADLAEVAIEDWPEWAGTADRGIRAFFGCIPDPDVLALGPAEFLRRARGGDYRSGTNADRDNRQVKRNARRGHPAGTRRPHSRRGVLSRLPGRGNRGRA